MPQSPQEEEEEEEEEESGAVFRDARGSVSPIQTPP
jgi:hypothetical protein